MHAHAQTFIIKLLRVQPTTEIERVAIELAIELAVAKSKLEVGCVPCGHFWT